MESDHHQQQQQQQQQPMSSGLMRYQSAPSSYFTNLINSGGGVYGGENCDQFLNPMPPTPENEQIFAKYMPSGGDPLGNEAVHTQFVGTMKHEEDNFEQEMIYQGQTQVDDNLVSSMGMDRLRQMKMGGGNNSNLIRHRSSPAGLFSDINIQNGYAAMRGTGDFGAGGGTNAEASFSSASRLKGQMDYPTSSWDDSAILPDNFLSGLGDNDRTTFSNLNSSENQNGEGGSRTTNVLSHHLSLPTSSAEFSAMEKLLQFQDSVPLKIRAKRGCATHPRSIAERVRRTRISERMRKLQDLVPNMDKQTNTADMLDLAVDYIKDLQKQVKKLSDNRAKCTCSK